MLLELLGLGSALYSGVGALRLHSAKDRVENGVREYELTHAALSQELEQRDSSLQSIAKVASRGVRSVVFAERMLSPLSATWTVAAFTQSHELPSAQLALVKAKSVSLRFYAAAGLATGVASAGALWCGAQVLGIASTGMPIAFLHGAALHNAALACLGGGSLATGGGGMLMGSTVLGAAVIVPGFLYFGFKSHSEASRLNEVAAKLETANVSNKSLLSRLHEINARLGEINRELDAETDVFEKCVRKTRRRLFRFGLMTHLYRLLRARWWSTYYDSEEMTIAEALSEATVRYTSLMDKFKSQTIH